MKFRVKFRFSELPKLLSIVGISSLVACATITDDNAPLGAPLSASAQRIQNHIGWLSDDAREGREAGTPAYDEAADYVAAEFKKLGLTPMGDDGSYFQAVPLVTTKRDPAAAFMSLTKGGTTSELESRLDYLVDAPGNGQPSEVTAELVFVGYGIVASQYGIDDYSGLDVAGKIVVTIAGAPLEMPSEVRAHYRSAATSHAIAASKGAVGMIQIIGDASEKRFSWDRRMGFADRGRVGWVTKEGHTFSRGGDLKVTASMSVRGGSMLFDGAEQSYASLNALIEAGERPKGFALPGTVTMKTAALQEFVMSKNVIAVLEGSDPELKNEYVVLSAHLDHIGIKDGDDPDVDHINNGAMDNASGIATTLEAARKFVMAAKDGGTAPKRSVLFIAVTAEEKGLIGSEYFANNPTVPADSMVSNVNLDMPLILYPFIDAIAFGADHSTLGPLVRDAAASMGVEIIADPVPDLALFVRSDHYRFVQQGVPAVFLFLGFGNGGEEVFKHFMSNNYHSPSDDIMQEIDYEQGARFSELNYRIAREIANAAERPKWNDGDFFGELYGK